MNLLNMKQRNLRSENKKNSNLKLISSTIKNLSKKGINELTMQDVSQGAGLSQGIVNFHFKSKELLLIETLKASLYSPLGINLSSRSWFILDLMKLFLTSAIKF